MTFIKFPLSDKFSSDVLLCLPTSAPLVGREDEPMDSTCLEKRGDLDKGGGRGRGRERVTRNTKIKRLQSLEKDERDRGRERGRKRN